MTVLHLKDQVIQSKKYQLSSQQILIYPKVALRLIVSCLRFEMLWCLVSLCLLVCNSDKRNH